MELGLFEHLRLFHFQLAQIGRCQRVNVLTFDLFHLFDLLDALLESRAKAGQFRIVRGDFRQNDERVSHLQVLLGLQAHNETLGQLVMPLVTHVSIVLVVQLLLLVRLGLSGVERIAEYGQKARMIAALLFEQVRVGVPRHHGLQETKQKAAITACLVVRETCDRVGDVREDAIVADDRAEIGRLEAVYDLNELGTVVRVDLREQAAREDAQLQEDRYGLILRFALLREPKVLLFVETGAHVLHVILLLLLLFHQLVEHDHNLLLLFLLLGRRELHVVVQRVQLVLQALLLLVVGARGHKAITHGQCPKRRVEQWTHVLPYLGRMQRACQVDHWLHDNVNRLEIALGFRRLVACFYVAIDATKLFVLGLNVMRVHGPTEEEGHVGRYVILVD